MKRLRYVTYTGLLLLLTGFVVYILVDSHSLPPIAGGSHKVVHISFDDVVEVLKELKREEKKYASIFECNFFYDLKELHDVYGAKFSLYVYEKSGDFNIADTPVKFREEFRSNSDWLKFGFHAIEPKFDRNMKFKDFKASFQHVCQAICRFADSISLSPVLRLHYFFGNDSVVTFINKLGVNSLLCADDERDNYDLSGEENRLLQHKFYLERGLKYFKTDLRYEKMGYTNDELELLCQRDTLVLFTHEWAYLPLTLRQSLGYLVRTRTVPPNWFAGYKLKKSIIWLRKHGYVFSFLGDK